MNRRLLIPLLCLVFTLPSVLRAQFGSPEDMATEAKISSVLEQIQAKASKGPVTESALAPELAELDQHAADFADFKEHAARFAFTKAVIYIDVIKDVARGRKLLHAVKSTYPGTEFAGQADQALAFLDKAEKRDVANAELIPLMKQVEEKARGGARTADAFAPEIAKLDALVGAHAKNPEAAAQVAYAKVFLYVEKLKDVAKGRELLRALVEKYPGTLTADIAQRSLAVLDFQTPAQSAPATDAKAETK